MQTPTGLSGSLMFGKERDFVLAPLFRVGEACPFVSPYTPLLWTTTRSSTLRRPRAIRCPMPIPSRSPSPPWTNTLREGLAILMPDANGMALPCRVWTPETFTKCAIFPLQPMPETRTHRSRSMPISERAPLSAVSIPKLPQPGHQSGQTCVAYS